jgi:hypothetical protein
MSNTLLVTAEDVIFTIEFIVSNYEDAQSKRLVDIREMISPSVLNFSYFRDCLLHDWQEARSKIQGIDLLFSNSSSICELCSEAKEKISDIWKRCGSEVNDLQHSKYENEVIAPSSDKGRGVTSCHTKLKAGKHFNDQLLIGAA